MNGNQTIFVEVRPAAGGDEAKIWASDLVRMYSRLAIKNGWKVDALDEFTLRISGRDVFEQFKHESGVHRVQRVPATERRGRVHTSTATVAVLPEIDDREISVNPQDLEWQFFRSGGKGGQNVNKVSTAVRLTHKASGIVVEASTERSQEQNRANALSILRSKLWEREEDRKADEIEGYRSAIGTGDRSEKIRTYNYPQDRVTDHRIKKSFGGLSKIVSGDLDKIIKALR